MYKILKKLNRSSGFILSLLVRVYQVVLSPDHSILFRARYPYGYCQFYPSCSEYTRVVLKEKGLVPGIFLSLYRVLSCNPITLLRNKKKF